MPDLDDWFTRHIDGAFMQALHQAIEATVTGNGTGERLGFLDPATRPPTPAEKAFAIIAPHLDDVALYQSRGKTARPA